MACGLTLHHSLGCPSTYLQVEELQAVEFVEDVVGQGREVTAVHMEALELLKSAEGSPLQPAEARVVPQVQLLQIPQLTEGACLNPRDVVGEQPQNLRQESGFYFRSVSASFPAAPHALSPARSLLSYLRSEAKRTNSELRDPVVLEEDALRLIGHSRRDSGEVLRLAAHSHGGRVAHAQMRARRCRTGLAEDQPHQQPQGETACKDGVVKSQTNIPRLPER